MPPWYTGGTGMTNGSQEWLPIDHTAVMASAGLTLPLGREAARTCCRVPMNW